MRTEVIKMKSALSLFAVLVLVGCASSPSSSNAPNVTLHLAQVNTPSDVFYFAGPVNIQYRLTISNPTSQPLTLTRLDLRTFGPGAYSLRTAATPMNLKIAPNGTSTYLISVWGRARGGYLASSEPVSIQGTAYFKGPSGSFVKIFNENIALLAA
jgi:hypothetical protein